jgi:hypothetical protein
MSKQKSKAVAFQARQGDVLIWEQPIEGDQEVTREDGAVVLAHGEVTGHKHQIREPGVCHLRREGVSAYTVIRVDSETVDLVHEEHGTISIPKGKHAVIIQEEYAPEEYRNVND